MKEIAIRTAVLAFAGMGAFLLWLPSPAPNPIELSSIGQIMLGSFYFWIAFIADAAAILALGLVALLMVRPDVHRGAIPLAICLCSAVTAWGVGSANDIPGFNALTVVAVVVAAILFAAAGLLRFLTLFPHSLNTEELADGLASLRWGWRDIRTASSVSDPIAARFAKMEALERKITRNVWLPLVGKSIYRRQASLTAKLKRWVRRLEAVGADRHNQSAAQQVQKPWSIAFLLTLLIVLAVLITPPPSEMDHISSVFGIAAVLGVSFGLLLPAPVVALTVARIGYLRADAEMKHRSLWVMEALLIAMAIFVIGMMADYVGHFLWDTRLFAVTALGAAIAGLAFVVCLILALFSGGAFDPRLMIRGTVFVGLLSIVLAFIFAVVENFVTNQIGARFNLPESTGMIVSAAIAAAVFGPLWKSANRWVSRQLRMAVPRGPVAGPKLYPSP